MKNKMFFLAIIALMIATTACGSLKKAGTTLPDTTTTQPTPQGVSSVDAVIATLGDWQSLQSGGNIALKGGNNFSSSIQVRMVRDQAIFISLRPMLGIEVGRLLITADSLYAVDKVHKRYIAEKVSMLTAGIPVTVSDVQDIFLGRPRIIGKGTLSEQLKPLVSVNNDGSKLFTIVPAEPFKSYEYAYSFDKANRITALSVSPQNALEQILGVVYSDVRSTTAGNIAHAVNVNATANKKRLEFSLSYKNIDWNGNVKIDRNIPSGYTRMKASDLFSLF